MIFYKFYRFKLIDNEKSNILSGRKIIRKIKLEKNFIFYLNDSSN